MVGIELETNLETIQVIDQMIKQGKLRVILDRNQTNLVNTVMRMVILGNITGRYHSM